MTPPTEGGDAGWDANPGYRTRELTDDDAWDAMQRAANEIVRAALSARLNLLDLGFADGHSLCKELDATCRKYAAIHDVVRYQRSDHPTEVEA